MELLFYKETEIDIKHIKYSVMITKSKGKWVFCKHRQRETWECPGGHVEPGETPLTAGKRELYEETGANRFTIEPITVYSVIDEDGQQYGMLYYAEIESFGALPEMEIERVELFDEFPENWTYPEIQPLLFAYVENWLSERDVHGNEKK